jgi:exopolysaccharide biosynthesis polyprenyl glycosylphosphotransferase
MKLHRDRYIFPLILLVAADLFIFSLAFMCAYAFRFSPLMTWLFPPVAYPSALLYFRLSLFIALVGIICFDRFGFYQYRFGLNRYVSVTALIVAVVVTYVFVMAALFNYRGAFFSRLTVALALPVTATLAVGMHFAARHLHDYMIRSGVGFIRTVLLGDPDSCRIVVDRLRANRGSEYQVVGVIDTTHGTHLGKGLTVSILGQVEDLHRILDRESISHVVVAPNGEEYNTLLRVIRECRRRRIRFEMVPELFEAMALHMDVEELGYAPIIALGETPLEGPARFTKRIMDLVIAFVALVVSAPIMALIAALIKLDSRGTVLFVQERVGNDGQTFRMYKFRSMVQDAEANTGPVWATADDPRRTKVGKWIRRYNLDELPQLLNVVLGDMSIVGPRPERPYFVNKFKESIPRYMRRHMVKSGITGWAQVNGLRGDTSVQERTFYDIYYVENWSLLFDLRILWRTLLSFKNAY